jgi:hypothetical protein
MEESISKPADYPGHGNIMSIEIQWVQIIIKLVYLI